MAKSGAQRKKDHYQRMKDKGLIKREVWVLPEYSESLKTVEGYLRDENFDIEMLKADLLITMSY